MVKKVPEEVSTMKQQEITEGNKLIAEFMGWKYDDDLQEWRQKEIEPDPDKWFRNLHFNTSWDWLMPVVEKIEGLGFKFGIIQTLVTVSSPEYVWNGGLTSESKIICVWHGVVEFIKWFNHNDNKPVSTRESPELLK